MKPTKQSTSSKPHKEKRGTCVKKYVITDFSILISCNVCRVRWVGLIMAGLEVGFLYKSSDNTN